jgi:hypothetical protein
MMSLLSNFFTIISLFVIALIFFWFSLRRVFDYKSNWELFQKQMMNSLPAKQKLTRAQSKLDATTNESSLVLKIIYEDPFPFRFPLPKEIDEFHVHELLR